ncbi:hypothetical protein [Botryobacter ruber]|uniref:hypothetical protein n=1 Tax=Botryobacter ruber TaxID=2171629 RepID=UPI001F0B728D|nr:hypothetical protein [Botryobacter ruber]
MAPTNGSARSSLIVQLSPSRKLKLSFTVQLVLTLFWLAWATMLLLTEDSGDGQKFLHYVFFALAFMFLVYVILQNTSIFGVQSYIEITSEYIVVKRGVFRSKRIAAIPDIAAVKVSPLALCIIDRSRDKIYLDLKQVRKKRDIQKVKEKMQELAARFNFLMETAG